ncbi:hypothetical protein B0A48_14025 [Cryoendolithus antarcticus]|uniref:RING-type domain-containing protein n=1 Tax=Cryoendolithus antarcticus TaxID=1507870 RepID=A0A1V8SMJ7_9PEZI|nr:hypothetical protein B0A48_14025 [Cryoendolithus antarcticus]
MSSPGDMDQQSVQRTRNADSQAPVQSRKRSRIGTKECIVCTDETFKTRFPKLQHADADQQTSDVCFKCWEVQLNGQVATKGFDSIRCLQCTHSLDAEEVRKLAKGNTFVAYLDEATSSFLTTEEEFFSCISAACSSGAPFHEEKTCEEHQNALRVAVDHAELNRESAALVKKISKPCPKCGISVQKAGGCDHMTCMKCRHEFCWPCSAAYRGMIGIWARGNTAHRDDRKYRPRRLPKAPAVVRRG